MFTSIEEQEFFLSFLKNHKKVLEYGSGQSTTQIGIRVKSLISIEHQEDWYNNVLKTIPENCVLILKKPNEPYLEGGDCGTYSQFKDYIEAPIEYGPYDVIFIDGRARIHCASICHLMAHKDTDIFIHDFQRPEYQKILEYLDLIKLVQGMALFKLKNHD